MTREPLKNVGEAASARQKQAKKRSLHAVNEHFEPVFNEALATQVVFQRFPRVISVLMIVALSSSLRLNAIPVAAELDDLEVVGRGVNDSIIVTFEGIDRMEAGALGGILLVFRNVSESTTYELLMDNRLSGRTALQLYDDETPVNDPYLDIPSRMLGDLSLDLTRMEPGDVFEYRMDIGEFSDIELYEHLEVVSIQFQMSVPIYHEGADTSRDEWIEIMHVLSTLHDLPVVNGPDL